VDHIAHIALIGLASQDPAGQFPAAVPVADIVVDSDHYVGVGDAIAMARFSTFFARRGRPAQLRVSNDMSFVDLRNSPALLIGAFSNPWTMLAQSGLRFVFERGEGTVLIRDQKTKRQWVWHDTPPLMDYAVISRIFDPRTGQPVITAAGLSHAGTQIAAEFLTCPEHLQAALGGAKPGWEKQNLQILLRAEVVGKTPGPPKVIETHIWPR
jgi:hypothetical protein